MSTVRLPSRRSSPAGLPVVAGVAEDPEQVVAQLERVAEVEAVARERREVVRVGAAGRRPDEQRVLDGVLRALVADDAAGPLDPLGGRPGRPTDRIDSTTSRNCPPISWVRIRSKTARPRARSLGGRPEVAYSSSVQ